jgi:hypothetical protein
VSVSRAVGIIGRDISQIDDIDEFRVAMRSSSQHSEKLKKAVTEMVQAHLTIFVNWMPLWDDKLDMKSAGPPIDSTERDTYGEVVPFKLPKPSLSIVPRYEALFQQAAQ